MEGSMKQLLTFFCSILLSGTSCLSATEGTLNGHVNWLTNYEEAVSQAKASSKPIILFFTGSDWCSWCTKLEQESLDTAEFVQNAGDKFIFVKLDFPLNTTLPPLIASQNKELQKRFNIRGFPTLVILDSQQQNQIGTIGYRAGGGKMYSDHLSKMVSEYSKYQQKFQTLNSQKYSSSDLIKMYETALANGYHQDLNQIIKAGEHSDDGTYFRLAHYRLLADEGQIKSKKALKLKKELIDQDPHNEKLTHYQIALINFDAANGSPDQSVAPLLEYIHEFGEQDKEHLWHLQMIISQVYFDKNNLNEALQFAESSYSSAPPSAKTEIAMAIRNIQAQAHVHN
jgi:protein disulfide-isomerase